MLKFVVAAVASAVFLASPAYSAPGDLLWHDEFDGGAGEIPGLPWHFFDANGSHPARWRDAIYDNNHAWQDGKGNLLVFGQFDEANLLRTSYIQTFDRTKPDEPGAGKFGPGVLIEARIDMSRTTCKSCFAGFWLYDPTDAYDGDPANGTEIDIAEFSRANDWAAKRYTVNSHVALKGWHPAAWIEADPTDGFHVYGLKWTADKLTWLFDGEVVYETTWGVSQSDNQAVILSFENTNGDANPFWHGTPPGGSAMLVVDYVRVHKL